jgi:nicotinate-nucleotide adenylyltransferase
MHVALFGGTFDPPHNGHQFITQQMLAEKIVDAVWFVPVKNHAFQREMSPVVDRVEMLKKVVADLHNPKVRIESYEIDHSAMSYSLETLEALSVKHPEHTFSWVIGSDNLAKFNQWHNYAELLKKFRVYVYPRQGYPPESLREGMIFLKDFPEITISATEVREKVQRGESIADLVNPDVEKYILEKKLYESLCEELHSTASL